MSTFINMINGGASADRLVSHHISRPRDTDIGSLNHPYSPPMVPYPGPYPSQIRATVNPSDRTTFYPAPSLAAATDHNQTPCPYSNLDQPFDRSQSVLLVSSSITPERTILPTSTFLSISCLDRILAYPDLNLEH
jgi:hypothetical protein